MKMPTRRAFLSAPAALAVPAAKANVKGLTRHDLPTPALIVELDALESNLEKMSRHLKSKGRAFRPHGKTHKSADIAKLCMKYGAVGACAAKISEAEALIDSGVTGLLVTSAVIGAPKIRQAVALAKKRPETIFCVDQAQNVSDLDAAASAAGVKLNLAIDLWVGRRTGILPGEPALELARHIAKQKNARLQGLQAYAGHSSHTKGFESRVNSSREAMGAAVETRRMIERDGIQCNWLSGGSTGTWNIDPEIDGITEHQPGSFLFMDIDYRRIGGQSGGEFEDFKQSLFVIATVISQAKPEMAVVDGGIKAFATDRGYGPELRGQPSVKYAFGGDEHGTLTLNGFSAKVGDRLEFVVPHCDPTVNLYDRIYAVRGEKVEAAFPVTARGKSQ